MRIWMILTLNSLNGFQYILVVASVHKRTPFRISAIFICNGVVFNGVVSKAARPHMLGLMSTSWNVAAFFSVKWDITSLCVIDIFISIYFYSIFISQERWTFWNITSGIRLKVLQYSVISQWGPDPTRMMWIECGFGHFPLQGINKSLSTKGH